jgi:hypothetical protein
MKLLQDFGVRALLATIGGLGFYVIVIYVLMAFSLDIAQIIAIVGFAQAPWMLALGFYFGTQINKPPAG